jgi:hypothetical protein
MSRSSINNQHAKVSIPRAAILKAITRCESVCNPAVIEKRLFSIHVRQLPGAEGKGWVVRVIDKANVDERHEENTNDKS